MITLSSRVLQKWYLAIAVLLTLLAAASIRIQSARVEILVADCVLLALTAGLYLTAGRRNARAESLLVLREAQLRTILDHAAVGMCLVDADGTVIAANVRYTEMQAQGADRIPNIASGRSGGSREPYVPYSATEGTVDFLCTRPDGTEWWARTTVSPLSDKSRGARIVAIEDVTLLKTAEETSTSASAQLTLQHITADTLAGSAPVDETFPVFLRSVCEQGKWTFGAYWEVQADESVLRCRHQWCAPTPALGEFAAANRQLSISAGIGILGRVWATAQPMWLPDVTEEGNVLRGLKAEHAGLKSAFIFPVVLEESVHGVVEFWTSDSRGADPRYMTTLVAAGAHVGSQLGRFLEREQAEERLRISEERFRTITEMAQDTIVTIDIGSRILSVNPASFALFGYTPEELIGRNLTVLMPENFRDAHVRAMERYAATGMHQIRWDRIELPGLHRDGSEILLEVSLAEFSQGGERTVTGYMRDITARKQEETALVYQALHDLLTDLPNRMLLLERLERAIAVGHRQRHPVALLFMDLNRFKEVNDTFGHHCGDLLLQHVALRLQKTLRESDTVARLGGDEFAVILPFTDAESAARAADRMADALAQPFPIDGHSLEIGASIGIAMCPEHGEDAATLMRRADVAMYAAKRMGADSALYSSERDEANAMRLVLTEELKYAIDNNQLLLQYQPKINLTTGKVNHVEALIRWQHPERGFTPPDAFIPLAEETGLVKPLSVWVMREALHQQKEWKAAGLDMRISINFSAKTLHDRDLVDTVVGLLESTGTDATCLQVEITESAIMENPDRALTTLTRLHDIGIWTSIDDFGTGYSSLGYLKRLPVDEIKIDKSFVMDMASNRDDASIVRSVVTLGHNLGLHVVAEGVDNKRTLDMLTEMGCDMAQGYYLSRPVNAMDLSAWVASRNRNVDTPMT